MFSYPPPVSRPDRKVPGHNPEIREPQTVAPHGLLLEGLRLAKRYPSLPRSQLVLLNLHAIVVNLNTPLTRTLRPPRRRAPLGRARTGCTPPKLERWP